MDHYNQSYLVLDQNLEEFFHDQVCQIVDENQHEITDEAKIYMIHLLTSFSSVENYFEKDSRGDLKDKPLAIRWLESLLKTPSKSYHSLKKIGDISLYTAGFFSESVVRKLINLDYYFTMGHMAYQRLSNISNKKGLSKLFDELGEKFPVMVDIISNVAYQTRSHSDQNILALFEKWQMTKSKHLQKILEAKGIITQYLPSLNRKKH
jgi:hypothetical protein